MAKKPNAHPPVEGAAPPAKKAHTMTPEMACARRVARAKQAVLKQTAARDKYKKLSTDAESARASAQAEFDAAKADLMSLA